MRRAWVGLLVAALLAGCGGQGPGPLGRALRVGAVWSLSGAAAAFGQSSRQGADLAVAQLNAAGGFGPQGVELVIEDDQSSAAGAVAAFERLLAGGVTAILGPTLSTGALAADPLAQAAGVPVLGVTNTADGITDLGSFIFRSALPERVVVPNTVRVTQQRLGYRRVAIVYDEAEAFSRSSAAVFAETLAALGVTVTVTETFTTGQTDFTAALSRVIATAPEAVMVSALANEAVALLLQARALGLPAAVPIIGGNGFNTPRIAAEAGAAAEGVISGAAWIASAPTPGNADFVAAYTARYGTPPDQFAAQAYGGVQTLADALRRAPLPLPANLRAALAATRDLPTVLGEVSFDPQRNAVFDPVVQVVRDGRFELY